MTQRREVQVTGIGVLPRSAVSDVTCAHLVLDDAAAGDVGDRDRRAAAAHTQQQWRPRPRQLHQRVPRRVLVARRQRQMAPPPGVDRSQRSVIHRME